MTRFILFFLIGFLLAQEAFPACISGFYDPISGTKWQTDCNSNLNRTGYVGYCNYSYTHSNGMAVYKDICIQKTNQTDFFDCPDNSMLPPGVSNCKGGRPYEPPAQCDDKEGEVNLIMAPQGSIPSCVDGCSVTGSEFTPVPINGNQMYKVTFTGSSCSGGSSSSPAPTECNPGEVVSCTNSDCACKPGNDDNFDCKLNDPDYLGTMPNGTRICGNLNCDPGYSAQLIGGVPFCIQDPNNEGKCSNRQQVRIDGVCQYPSNYEQQQTVESVVIGEDGTKTTTTTTTTTNTDSSGQSSTTTHTTITQETLIDPNDPLQGYNPPAVIQSSTESTEGKGDSSVRGGLYCDHVPSCLNADAVACAILQQSWFTRCNTAQLKDLLDTKATLQLNAINSTNSKLDTLNNSTNQTNNKLDSANTKLDSIATNTNTTNTKLDSLLTALSTANSYLNTLAGGVGSGGEGGSGEGGEGQGNGTASGGGTCETAPTCSENADQVQCAILLQNWYLRCDSPSAGKNEGFTYSDAAEGILTAAKESFSDFMDDLKGEIGEYFTFDLTSQEGGIPCNQVEMWGVEVDISWCRFTEQLAWLGYVFIALAYIKALQIILD